MNTLPKFVVAGTVFTYTDAKAMLRFVDEHGAAGLVQAIRDGANRLYTDRKPTPKAEPAPIATPKRSKLSQTIAAKAEPAVYTAPAPCCPECGNSKCSCVKATTPKPVPAKPVETIETLKAEAKAVGVKSVHLYRKPESLRAAIAKAKDSKPTKPAKAPAKRKDGSTKPVAVKPTTKPTDVIATFDRGNETFVLTRDRQWTSIARKAV
jgi:hypothetical protein